MGQNLSKSTNANQKRQKIAPHHIYLLPEELIIYIFSFLDVKTLGILARVSIFWKALAEEDMLWKAIDEKHFSPVKSEGKTEVIESGGLDNQQPREKNEPSNYKNNYHKKLLQLAEILRKIELQVPPDIVLNVPPYLPLALQLVQPFQFEPLVLPNNLYMDQDIHQVPEIFQHERQLSPTRSHFSLFSEYDKIHRQLRCEMNFQNFNVPETEVFYYDGKPNFTRRK